MKSLEARGGNKFLGLSLLEGLSRWSLFGLIRKKGVFFFPGRGLTCRWQTMSPVKVAREWWGKGPKSFPPAEVPLNKKFLGSLSVYSWGFIKVSTKESRVHDFFRLGWPPNSSVFVSLLVVNELRKKTILTIIPMLCKHGISWVYLHQEAIVCQICHNLELLPRISCTGILGSDISTRKRPRLSLSTVQIREFSRFSTAYQPIHTYAHLLS